MLVEKEKPEVEIINAGEDAVKILLAKLRKLKVEKDVAIGSLLLNLQELQDEIHVRAMPYDHESEVIAAEIKNLMPAIARTIKTENGAVSYRKGYTKVSWDTKALDACTDEYVKQAILPYRKVTEVAPSIGEPEVF